MNTFGINNFRSVRDGVHNRLEDMSWDEFSDFIVDDGHMVSETKESIPLFNATRFKPLDQVMRETRDGVRTGPDGNPMVRRQKQNALAVELLILDYDGTITLDEAQSRFSKYEYVGYTSYGHLSKPGVHKFRLVFPLTEPIPAFTTIDPITNVETDHGIYYDLSEALMEFAPACDPVVTRVTQAYYFPSVPAERLQFAKAWRNTGEVLNWKTWTPNQPNANPIGGTYIVRGKSGRNSRNLDPQQSFTHGRTSILAKDVKGRLQKVHCPFHADPKGTEFLVRYESGVVCFHCKSCGTFTLQPPDVFSSAAAKVLADSEPALQGAVLDTVEFEETRWDHEDRERISKFLTKTKATILADKGGKDSRQKFQFKSHIIYLPEGAGKSQLALDFLSGPPQLYFPHVSGVFLRNQIIFACKSWKQVLEKQQSFEPELKRIGRTSRVAWSLDGSIYRRFNVRIRREAGGPFIPGRPLPEATIQQIVAENPHLSERFIRIAWTLMSDDPVRFRQIAVPDRVYAEADDAQDDEEDAFGDLGEDPPAIIFTTFAQLRIVSARHDYIPLNWIIWVDDPDIDELSDIKPQDSGSRRPASESYPDDDGEDGELPEQEITTFEGITYDVRPARTSLGASFRNHRCIYTTTEKLTLRLLKHHLEKAKVPYQTHGERHKITGGKVTLLGTKWVGRKFDAVIPLVARDIASALNRPITLIADGIPAEFNHSNSKGRNDLKKRDLIVEVSQPHPSQIRTLCHVLGLLFNENKDEIGRDLMLDKLHQAIGRNSGYRTSGFESVVLVDRNRHSYLTRHCAYDIDVLNSVLIDKTNTMGRTETRLDPSASVLVSEFESRLNNMSRFFSDGRKIKPNIRSVLEKISDDLKREQYIVRLLHALTSISTVRFDLPWTGGLTNSFPLEIRELGEWVLETFSPQEKTRLLSQYSSGFGPTGG